MDSSPYLDHVVRYMTSASKLWNALSEVNPLKKFPNVFENTISNISVYAEHFVYTASVPVICWQNNPYRLQ